MAYHADSNMIMEFTFTNDDFDKIRKLVKYHTGISLSDTKKNLVYSRLARQLRRLGLNRFSDYCKFIESCDTKEITLFTNSITTNLTYFFRENHHFEFLSSTVIPQLIIKNSKNKRIRIWSAACSTGEEPYSIAITMLESIPNPKEWDINILATDLNTNVLNIAREGIYSLDSIDNMSSDRLRRWFLKGKHKYEGYTKIAPQVKELITFKKANLLDKWDNNGPFDIIFCRNVVIYFDKETQATLFNRISEVMPVDGHLFIGHSESLYRISNHYKLIGKTVYRKL